MSIGERLRASRRAKGLTQREAAEQLGVSQAMIDKLERDLTVRSRHLVPYATMLGLPSSDIETYLNGEKLQAQVKTTAPSHPVSASPATNADIPLYATTESAPGRLDVGDEPYGTLRPGFVDLARGTYGLLIGGDAMAPVLSARDVAIVQPHLPPRTGSRVAIFNHLSAGRAAVLGEFVGHTADAWRVRLSATSKAESELPKSEWRVCHCIAAVIFGT